MVIGLVGAQSCAGAGVVKAEAAASTMINRMNMRSLIVMPGFMPGIHVLRRCSIEDVDGNGKGPATMPLVGR
jgi:hypothetical protein